MKTKTIQVAILAVAVTITTVLVVTRPPSKVSGPDKLAVVMPATSWVADVATEIKPNSVPIAEAVGMPAAQPASKEKTFAPTRPTKKTAGNAAKPKEPIEDPVARAALSLVGVDPEAEQYWMTAINDPNLPANERKDLIEDLNEDGLSDPHHPGPQDLPLILNRIRLIEEVASDAMDQVNADAFQEAYKDLNNMLAGKPVQ